MNTALDRLEPSEICNGNNSLLVKDVFDFSVPMKPNVVGNEAGVGARIWVHLHCEGLNEIDVQVPITGANEDPHLKHSSIGQSWKNGET
jgi:hypothetical protein